MGPQLAQKMRSISTHKGQGFGEGGSALQNKAGHAHAMQACRILRLGGRVAGQAVFLAEAEKRVALHRQPFLRTGNRCISRVFGQSGGLPLAHPLRAPTLERHGGGRVRHGGVSPHVIRVTRALIRTTKNENAPNHPSTAGSPLHPIPSVPSQHPSITRSSGERPTLPAKLTQPLPVRHTGGASIPRLVARANARRAFPGGREPRRADRGPEMGRQKGPILPSPNEPHPTDPWGPVRQRNRG